MVPTKITNSRIFRAGRVLHSAYHDAVLINSPEPRTWNVVYIRVNKGEGEYEYVSRVKSETLVSMFDKFDTGVRKPLTVTATASVATTVMAKFGVAMDWRTKAAFRQASRYPMPATITAPPIISDPLAFDSAYVDDMIKALDTDKAKSAPATVKPEPKVLGRRESAFTTPTLPEKPYWYESDNDRKLLRDFIELRKTGFTVNLMIAGPSGSGKTVGVEKLAEELGIPCHKINCQAITTPEKWIGQMHADPERGTVFVPSQHIQWVERTHPDCEGHDQCILLYDEITRLRPELNNMTYSLFDTQRGLEVPQMGRQVKMAPENLIISTANIGAAFAGTFGQDRAFRERFSMTLERDFPPSGEEIKILTSATGVENSSAVTLTKVADATRRLWREGTIEQPISTRTLVTWALLIAGGYDVMQAAEYTVLPLYSDDGGVESDRAKVRLQIEGKAS